MDKICYGKWTAWIAPVVMLLLSLFYVITAQPDFLSISCGAKTNHTADNNITWITDAHYIDVGQSLDDIGDLSKEAYGSYLHSSRYFPEPLNKSCYQLPVAPDMPYLLRLWFPPSREFVQSFTFSIETVDMLAHRSVRLDQYKPIWHEFILVTKGRELYICLVRSDYTYPAISAIEMRRLQEGMYIDAHPGRMLATLSRYDVGGNLTVRYPQDKFDRIWTSDLEASSDLHNISSKEPISTNNASDLPPTAVLQTACVVNNEDNINLVDATIYDAKPISGADRTLLLLYFAEIERLNMSQSRSFSVSVDGVLQRETITLSRNYSAQEFAIYPDTAPNLLDLLKSSDSTLPPIINAFECYGVYLSDQATHSEEINALNAIKSRFDIKDWISPDPCYLIPWDGISCDNSKISELNLSGRNLTGAVPGDIAQLISLVTLSLAHNHLTGPVPDLRNFFNLEGLYLQNNNLKGTLEFLSDLGSSLRELSLDHNGFTGPVYSSDNVYSLDYAYSLERLNLQNNNLNGTLDWLPSLGNLREVSLNHNQFTGPMPYLVILDKLERLYLQNNKLNGNVERWLPYLQNLQELNIANNNFSGVFPDRLLLNCSLKLNYSGNPYLRILGKRECNLDKKENKTENSDNHKKENRDTHKKENMKLMVVLGILFIALMVDKFVKLRIKFYSTESKHFLNQDRLTNMVSNARAFTLDEMIAATQNFRREIGRGGFGSVFFGKLPEGKVIAVKVLSLFSRQGIQEFLNEVDLLSKINHRNLVSLLGYCSKTEQVMLIYEHMSGGSLRDHLYGPRAENSYLNWKRRLRIALDAAQGLEYLHVGCTPKIIHRDIKTANILLDGNLNGKLADFGLSRVTTDEEGTHVTTTVKGTIGYLDPEYYNTQMLTEKSDVYSFGVVLLEIICGRPPIDTNLPEEELNIVRWVTPHLLETDENGGKIIDVIDKRLCGDYCTKSMINVAKTAMRCVQALPSSRPPVSEVVAELKEAIDNDSISIAEENGIQNGHALTGEANSTKREGMEWSDNSSNMPNEGR
eukprot:PITA_28796